MDLSTAKAKAKILTAERGFNHVIYEVNNSLYIAIESEFIGNPIETVKYEAPIIEKISPKSQSKKVQSIQDVPGITDQEVL